MAKSREAFRTISEVAEWLDVQTHVLRFWESKFSQVKPVKRAGGRRYYRPEDMELLGGLKKLLHEDGMPIKDAQQLLREKGVKHVSSLSRPVDEEAQAVEAPADDKTEDVVHEAGNAPQEEPQAPHSKDVTQDAEATPEEALEAVAEKTDDTSEDNVQLTDEAVDDIDTGQVETVNEVFGNTLHSEPDDLGPDGEAPIEDDDDYIPEDLLVKIEDDEPAVSTAPEPLPENLTESIPAPEQTLSPRSDAFVPEQDTEAAVASTGTAEDMPPMDDLFSALETPTSPAPLDEEHVATSMASATAEPSAPADFDSDPSEAAASANTRTNFAETDGTSSEVVSETISEPLAERDDLTDRVTQDNTDNFETTALGNAEITKGAPSSDSLLRGDTTPVSQPSVSFDAPTETASAQAGMTASSASTEKILVARETARDDFLLMLTKPIQVEAKNASRAASLLARLEALHGKAS